MIGWMDISRDRWRDIGRRNSIRNRIMEENFPVEFCSAGIPLRRNFPY
jgi:hypothetical protein